MLKTELFQFSNHMFLIKSHSYFFFLFKFLFKKAFIELSFKREPLTLVSKELEVFPRQGQRDH